MKTLYLCGAGNPDGVRLAQRINRQQSRWDRLVVLDDDERQHGRSILGVTVEGCFCMMTQGGAHTAEVTNLVARTTPKRSSARARIEVHGLPFATLADPGVDIDAAILPRDIIIYQHATIGAEASINEGSVVFMGAVVGHECRVGRCCVVAANAVLNARVQLGDGVYVGANATVLPEIKIGDWATVGAGSVVLQDVPAGATAMGVPAQILTLPQGESAARLRIRDAAESTSDFGPVGNATADATTAPPVHRTDLEQAVLQIWQEALHLAHVGLDQNFFDLGGTSLLALRVREGVRQATGVDLPITELYRYPTIRSLVSRLSAAGDEPEVLDTAGLRAALRRRFLHQRTASGLR